MPSRSSLLPSGHVSCSVDRDVAEVRLERPDKLNALTLPVLDDLVRAARALRRDRSLRAVVLTGAGDSFCAGLDFGEVMRSPARLVTSFVPRPWRGTNTFQEAVWAWRRLPVPVVAAVHGHCYGGGLQLALGADFRFTTPDAQWSVLEARWGLIPDMTGIRCLSQLVGIDTAKRLTMTGQVLSGRDAHAQGLATGVDTDARAAARDLVEELRGRSPDAVAAAKRLFERSGHDAPRRTFARERAEQALLLAAGNTRAARQAAFARSIPAFGPRGR